MKTPSAETEADVAERVVGRFRVAIGVATLAMLGLSWPLWVDTTDFPRVPFFGGLPELPPWVSWALFLMLMATLAMATAGIAWRKLLGLDVLLVVALVVQDQGRFQPWIYQFAMAALALATTSGMTALGLVRLFIIAMYVHSGLSKLDASFVHEMGRLFLVTALAPFGVDPARWPKALLTGVILLMPAMEIVIGVGLCFRKTRRMALVGAIGMHLALLWILGPFGLGHSTIVLIWNAALIAQNVVLFGPMRPGPIRERRMQDTRLASLTRWVFLLAATLPLGERLGMFDAWPSFALYASHTEGTSVIVHDPEDLLPRTFERIPTTLVAISITPHNYRVNLNAWSLAVRGVPVYPQNRARNGLAEALAARYPGITVTVAQLGPTNPWTFERASAGVQVGMDQIRRLGDRYRLNAHPAGAGWTVNGTGRANAR